MIKCCCYGILPQFGPIQPPGIDLFRVGHILKGSFQSLISSELFQGCYSQLIAKLKPKPLSWLSTLVLGIPEFHLSSRDLSFFGQVHFPSRGQLGIGVGFGFCSFAFPVVSALLEPGAAIPAPSSHIPIAAGKWEMLKVETTFAASRFVSSPQFSTRGQVAPSKTGSNFCCASTKRRFQPEFQQL